MGVTVIKFGGTSIKDRQGFHLAIKHIEREMSISTNKIICVVSAMGRGVDNDTYSTDILKNLINNYVSSREQDRLISVGETISSVVFTDFLIEHKIRAISLSTKEIGIITDDNHTNANIIAFDEQYIEKIMHDYDVIVVPGFQGITTDGYLTTLGRGGSDTTAIYLGIKMNADYIKIVSDVNGIYSGDPRVILNAYKYDQINYDQLVNITRNGSKVLHYKGAKFANTFKVKLLFSHINDVNSYTKVSESNVPLFNITSKQGYYKFTFNEEIDLFEGDYYLDSYYIEVDHVEHFEIYLNSNHIKYTKESGFSKISILIDNGTAMNKFAFVEDKDLDDYLNTVHDFYLFRG